MYLTRMKLQWYDHECDDAISHRLPAIMIGITLRMDGKYVPGYCITMGSRDQQCSIERSDQRAELNTLK